MSISVGPSAAAAAGYAGKAYGAASAAPKSAPPTDSTDTSSSSSTNVTLSDEAKAYLAAHADEAKAYLAAQAADDPPSMATLTANARAWFDQQYASLGVSSAMLDGQVAVDLASQPRATLSLVADNALGQFTTDETTAAAKALQARFDDAMAPHVVIARHTGDYASLYAAASDYLDSAGADEKSTATWQNQKQAVLEGIAAASANFGKAPVTDNDDDPVRSVLTRTSMQTPAAAGSGTDALSASARAMLDAQASSARDNGKELVFNSGRKTGQQVDFTEFDNRSLAIVALNVDASFSGEEAGAAKAELNQRTRSGVLNAFDPGSGGGLKASTQALLQQYSTMSAEEKKVLGFTDEFANRIMQNYRAMSSLQNSVGSGAGLTAYF
ncbi:MAG TPA: hypothetical protein VK567_02595 [Bradyrhizobium sp.]|nr:hypothetical protein [Bradyrhizobium sp.]